MPCSSFVTVRQNIAAVEILERRKRVQARVRTAGWCNWAWWSRATSQLSKSQAVALARALAVQPGFAAFGPNRWLDAQST